MQFSHAPASVSLVAPSIANFPAGHIVTKLVQFDGPVTFLYVPLTQILQLGPPKPGAQMQSKIDILPVEFVVLPFPQDIHSVKDWLYCPIGHPQTEEQFVFTTLRAPVQLEQGIQEELIELFHVTPGIHA